MPKMVKMSSFVYLIYSPDSDFPNWKLILRN